MSTPLLDIALMDFDQLSKFVQTATEGALYIANPSESTEIDREVCAEYVINTVIMPALKNEHKRADARSRKAQNGDKELAQLLASAALSFWMDRGFIIAQNARVNRAISAQMMEQELEQRKSDLIELQMQKIGAMLTARKIRGTNMLQGMWDFEESALQIARISNEGFEFGDLSPVAIA